MAPKDKMSTLRRRPTLCLNMIVKNESKVITRLLESVAKWIDSYCICDTGSTDDTMQIIQTFFETKQIPGRICQEPFRDFGYNRTHAFRECETMGPLADFALFLDADMVFWVNPAITREELCDSLDKDGCVAVSILQGSDQFHYQNTRIVKTGIGASYWGVTHEYIQLPSWAPSPRTIHKSQVFILDIGDGGSKADKFERDIRLLKQGLLDNPQNVRYTFYLANSLRDSGRNDEAIAMYEKRASMPNTWIEEVWYSYYAMGVCYMRQQKSERAIYAWMQAYQRFPERLENLYEIIRFYRNNCQYTIAQAYYAIVQQQRQRIDYSEKTYLFMQRDVYDYKLDYEMTVAGYYCNFAGLDLARLSMSVLAYPAMNVSLQKNVLANYKFYVPKLVSVSSSSYFNAAFFECARKATLPIFDGFAPSVPAFVMRDKQFIICTRHVNYRIGDKGEYIRQDKIETRNVLTILDRDDATTTTWSICLTESLIDYDRTQDETYVGVEDVRLFLPACNLEQNRADREGSDLEQNRAENGHSPKNASIQYSGNRILADRRMVIEVGQLVLSSSSAPRLENAKWLQYSPDKIIEKNWVWASETHMVYAWHPLTLGTVSPWTSSSRTNLLNVTHELSTPSWFQHVRGSSCGVVVGPEMWFLCHLVSYEDRRIYYHLVVILDAKTYELKKHTRLFKLSEEKAAVEYALGFLYESSTDEFLIGYSVMDCRTEFMVVPRQTLLDLCC